MDEYAQLTDAADQEWEHYLRSQEEQEWLRDEAAQTEYLSWLALLDSQRHDRTRT